MTFDKIIIYIIAAGVILGGVDCILDNRFGLGKMFKEGLNAMGPLAFGMVGFICLAPVISNVIAPVVTPACKMIGIDPAMIGSIIACDMGGYSLATNLAQNAQMGLYAGILISSMLGCTIVFTIPVGLSMIEKEDKPYFAKGLLIGIITVPLGSFVGGLTAGFDLPILAVNTVPVLVVSCLMAIGIKFIPNAMIKGCMILGRFITIIILIGLIAAGVEGLTGIVVIQGMTPITEAMGIVGNIAVVLMGTLPVLHIFLKILDKPFKKLGNHIGIDSESIGGMVINLATVVPVFVMYKKMKPRGKVFNIAFMVTASCTFGDHLGFVAGVERTMIVPLICGKLVGGISALALAYVFTKEQ